MYSFTDDDIDRLSKLARIQITQDGKERLRGNLEKVVRYVEQLSEVPTENVPLCVHVNDKNQSVFRADEVEHDLTREAFLANAPDQVGGMIKTPPVIKFE